MLRHTFVCCLLLALPLAAPSAQAKGDKKAEAKKEKKKKSGKKKSGKGGPFTSCEALTTKSDCEAHAKDHFCSWDAIAAGGSCSEGAPM